MDREDRLTKALDLILAWINRSRQRAQLAGIDMWLLKDVGISAADIEVECRKHFWQR